MGSSSSRISAASISVPRMPFTRAVRTRTVGGTGSSPRTSTVPVATRWTAGPRSSMKRSCASSMISGSQPFSNRAEASLRTPSRRDDLAIAIGWNHAISTSTSVVDVGDLRRRAAHDAADAVRDVVRVTDEKVVGREAALDAVEGDQRLAVASSTHAQTAATHEREVVRMRRLPELEHHVVRHVDDVVDRAHAEQRQAAGDARRRRPDRDALQHARGEASAQIGSEVLDRDEAVDRIADGDRAQVGCRQRERHLEVRGEIAGDAGDRHRVGPVRIDLEVVQHVGFEAERLAQRCAGL